MGPFTQWMKKRGLYKEDFDTDSPADKFKFNNDNDSPRDYEKDFKELTKILWSKYFKEFTQFVAKIGEERGDKEVKDLLSKIQMERKNAPVDNWNPSHPKEKDVISTPMADRGHDQNSSQ